MSVRPSVLYVLLPSSAQAPAQLIWAELVVFLLYPAPAHLAGARPPTQNSSEIDGNKQNSISNICRSTLGELNTILEDDLKF